MQRSPDGRRRVTLLVAVLLVVAPALPADTRDELPRLRGKVVGIADGDTIDVRLESGMLRVRLHGVDAPEHDQPWGRAAKRALSKLVYRENVEVEPITQDQYERIVARVWLDGRDVNAELVQSGNAWVYRRYATEAAYCANEHAAREASRGLWSLPRSQWVAPWEWRQREHRRKAYSNYAGQTVAQCVKSLGR